MRGPRTQLQITLSTQDRLTMADWQHTAAQDTKAARGARRGQILELLAAGATVTATAQAVGLTRRHVYKWVKRWQQAGITGLLDTPRRRHVS